MIRKLTRKLRFEFFRRSCGAFSLVQPFWVWILKILISEIWRHEYRRTRYASLWWCRQGTRRQRQRRCSSCLPPSLGLKYIFGKRIPTYVRCIYSGLEKSFLKNHLGKTSQRNSFLKTPKRQFHKRITYVRASSNIKYTFGFFIALFPCHTHHVFPKVFYRIH